MIRRAVLERDGHCCRYCGAPATTVDHVVPATAGGGEEMDNLVAACAQCNDVAGDVNPGNIEDKARMIRFRKLGIEIEPVGNIEDLMREYGLRPGRRGRG